MRIENEKLMLPCVLTNDEKLSYGLEMATETQRVVECEGRKQSFNSSIKAEIETHEARAHEIGNKLTSGKEYRDVECKIERNWEEKTRRWIRLDTGEIAKEDIIPEHELQEELELNEEKTRKEQDVAVKNAEEELKAFDDPNGNIVQFKKGKKVKKYKEKASLL